MLIVDGLLRDARNQIVLLSLCLRARHIKSGIKTRTNTHAQKQYKRLDVEWDRGANKNLFFLIYSNNMLLEHRLMLLLLLLLLRRRRQQRRRAHDDARCSSAFCRFNCYTFANFRVFGSLRSRMCRVRSLSICCRSSASHSLAHSIVHDAQPSEDKSYFWCF